jgi:hypothetical protein
MEKEELVIIGTGYVWKYSVGEAKGDLELEGICKDRAQLHSHFDGAGLEALRLAKEL